MSGYWQATDKIPISQKSVRIPAENGVNYIAGQEIRIRIDPTHKFFNPKDTYLEAKVKLIPPTYSASGIGTLPSPTKLQLDAETGFHSLCRSVRIHDNNGVLLEEIENYNTLVAVKYDYHTNNSLRNKRALTEGSTTYDLTARGTVGNSKSVCNTTQNNPYFEQSQASPITASWTSANFVDCKVAIPLHTGIMSNDKIFPNMILGGITITILLEDNNRVFRQLEGAMGHRRLALNPVFLNARNLAGASGPVANNGSFNAFRTEQSNAQFGAPQCSPFCVGEVLGFQRNQAGNASYVDFTNASHDPVIKSIHQVGQNIEYRLNASVEVQGTGINQGVFVISKSVSNATAYNPTYQVSDVNLVLQEISAGSSYENAMLKKMREGGTINYDFLSATCYKYSQLSSDRVANIRLPINNQRCKSILCVPTDATVYSSKDNINASITYQINASVGSAVVNNPDYFFNSNRSGLEGITDNISNYQWLYDGRLQPNRQVPLTKTAGQSIDAQHLLELDKALSQADIHGHSMARYKQNFIIGRALSLGDGVYDARNKEFSLQVNYDSTTAPVKNKLWCNYVFHIRRIVLNGDSVSVQV